MYKRQCKEWNTGSAPGPDGITCQHLKGLLQDETHLQAVLGMFNDSLVRASIPPTWLDSTTTLLPKTRIPLHWAETRPITLTNTIGKWVSQILLRRLPQLTPPPSQPQFASRGRTSLQAATLVRRLLQKIREWREPALILKLDIKKAFDTTCQQSVAQLIERRLRDHAPHEGLLLLDMIRTKQLTIQILGRRVQIDQTNGVRQGSPESPVLFATSIAECAPEARPGSSALPGCGLQFMDDAYLWASTPHELQHLLDAFLHTLSTLDLKVNPSKTQLIASTVPLSTATLRVGDATVKAHPPTQAFAVVGTLQGFEVPQMHDQQAAVRRAHAATGAHRDLLCDTDLSAGLKLRLFDQLVAAKALWCCSTWHPGAHHLRYLNTSQLQLLRSLLAPKRKPGEDWATWHCRSLRTTRALLAKHNHARWSTITLTRIWALWGAMGAVRPTAPPIPYSPGETLTGGESNRLHPRAAATRIGLTPHSIQNECCKLRAGPHLGETLRGTPAYGPCGKNDSSTSTTSLGPQANSWPLTTFPQPHRHPHPLQHTTPPAP